MKSKKPKLPRVRIPKPTQRFRNRKKDPPRRRDETKAEREYWATFWNVARKTKPIGQTGNND